MDTVNRRVNMRRTSEPQTQLQRKDLDYQRVSPLSESEYSKPFDNLEDMWADMEI